MPWLDGTSVVGVMAGCILLQGVQLVLQRCEVCKESILRQSYHQAAERLACISKIRLIRCLLCSRVRAQHFSFGELGIAPCGLAAAPRSAADLHEVFLAKRRPEAICHHC